MATISHSGPVTQSTEEISDGNVDSDKNVEQCLTKFLFKLKDRYPRVYSSIEKKLLRISKRCIRSRLICENRSIARDRSRSRSRDNRSRSRDRSRSRSRDRNRSRSKDRSRSRNRSRSRSRDRRRSQICHYQGKGRDHIRNSHRYGSLEIEGHSCGVDNRQECSKKYRIKNFCCKRC